MPRVKWTPIFVQCPGCKALETAYFHYSRLEKNRRFKQDKEGKIYHSCGSQEPCKLIGAGGKGAENVPLTW